MSLPTGQQRVLEWIETDLEAGEPRLKSMFAIFTRLTRDEGAPRTESLRLRGRLAGHGRTVITLALLLGLVTLSVLVAVTSSAGHGCRPGPGVHGESRTVACQSAQLAGRG